MRKLLPALALLLLPSLLAADEYTLAADGYYYCAGVPFTRTRVDYTETVYSCGRCYRQPFFYYTYQRYYPPAPVIKYTEDWRSRLLEIAAERDRFEGKLRAASQDNNAFLLGVEALGLGGNFRWEGYGAAPPLAYPYHTYSYASRYSNPQLGNFGASGSTLYGYDYKSLSSAYSDTDMNILFQQASALAKNSQDLGAQATTQFGGLVEQAGNSKARVIAALARAAEVAAKGQAASAALNAAAPANSVTIENEETGMTDSQERIPGLGNLSPRQRQAVAQCLKCHVGPRARNGYEVLKHWTLPVAKQMEVVRRLMAPVGSEKHMPKGGPSLDPELISEFMAPRMSRVE